MTTTPYSVTDFAKFCRENLKIEDGSALKIEPFQRALLRDYFHGTTETLALIPKKNGKTTPLARKGVCRDAPTSRIRVVIADACFDGQGEKRPSRCLWLLTIQAAEKEFRHGHEHSDCLKQVERDGSPTHSSGQEQHWK